MYVEDLRIGFDRERDDTVRAIQGMRSQVGNSGAVSLTISSPPIPNRSSFGFYVRMPIRLCPPERTKYG